MLSFDFIEINLGIELVDSRLIQYNSNYFKDVVILKIKTSDNRILEVYFYSVLLFIVKHYRKFDCFGITNIETNLMREALFENYRDSKKDRSDKCFQFLNEINQPAIEIICNRYECKII